MNSQYYSIYADNIIRVIRNLLDEQEFDKISLEDRLMIIVPDDECCNEMKGAFEEKMP